MHKQLNLSFKKVSERFLPFSTQDHQDHYYETAAILHSILLNDILICYVDEYKVSEQDFHLYNWAERGKDDFVYNQPRMKSLSVIAAVTHERLVALYVSTEMINSEIFSDFL
jgi:hypothetical protein